MARSRTRVWVAMVLASTGAAACTAAREGDPEATGAVESAYEGTPPMPTGAGKCRGTCYPTEVSYVDMAGNAHKLPSYRCVDYAFSSVNADSRISARASCDQVAQCIADGLCDQYPAVLPEYQWLGPGSSCVQDGDGTWWCRARVEGLEEPHAYFLYPQGGSIPRTQSLASYTLTEPPRTADVASALGGKQPCGEDVEHMRGPVTCAPASGKPVCANGDANDASQLTFATAHCFSDPQLDVPRQYFKVTGEYPGNHASSSTQVRFDERACTLAALSVAGSVGGAIVGAASTGGIGSGAAFKLATGALMSATKCIPTVTPPGRIEVYVPGPSFWNGPMAWPPTPDIEKNVDTKGQVCSRTIPYDWAHTREARILTLQHGIPYDAWGVIARAESYVRFRSGNGVTIRATEPCACKVNPGDVGLDCAPGTQMFPPWKLTVNDSPAKMCDFRGCSCDPKTNPVAYDPAAGMPNHPCPMPVPPPVGPSPEAQPPGPMPAPSASAYPPPPDMPTPIMP